MRSFLIVLASGMVLIVPSVQASDSAAKENVISKEKSPDMTAYMSSIKQKIQRVWHSPDVQSNCVVTVLFSVDKNGALVSNAVKKSSGIPNVDQIAVQTIKKSAPFPKLPEGTGRFSVEYSFECGPHKSVDAYMFNGVPIKDQEYKMSSGGSTLRNLDTDSPAERKLQERAAALHDKADSLQARLDELQKASPQDNGKISAVMLELANASKQLQKYEKAESLYKSVVASYENSENQIALTNALFDFANLYYVIGKNTDAESLYEQALSVQSKNGNQPVNKQALNEYAKTLYKLNKTSKADEIYKQLR